MSAALQAPLARRLWAYQAERFPLFKHGLAIAAFATAASTFPSALGGVAPNPKAIAVAVGASFLLFLQLRIADEHKDFEADRRFRPERPVPRGLVRLRELRWVAFAAAIAQAALAAALDPALLAQLALVWGWMALMTFEFFAPAALKARPALYMASHLAIVPLIAFFCIACGASGTGSAGIGQPPLALGAFLTLALVNGAAMEIARKCWAPEDERPGVETYSRLWGPRWAAIAAAIAILLGAALTVLALGAGAAPGWLAAVVVVALLAVVGALAFAAAPGPRRARALELGAGLWVLACYAALAAWGFGA